MQLLSLGILILSCSLDFGREQTRFEAFHGANGFSRRYAGQEFVTLLNGTLLWAHRRQPWFATLESFAEGN